MYGKIFEGMYEGSMYGAGMHVFAVWGYVIARMQKGRVELNPKMLADILGGEEEDVISAIEYLTQPDTNSRTKDFDGRRMVKEGQFQYLVPSWEYYRNIRNEEDRREYNRLAQAKHRAKAKGSGPLNGETEAIQKVDSGHWPQERADEVASESRENPNL